MENQELKSGSNPITYKEALSTMEHQELKSVSTPVSTPTVEIPAKVEPNISIEALAQQFQAYVPLTYKELRERFDAYWIKNMEVLMKQLQPKLKKKKGGSVDPVKAQEVLENTFKANKLYRSVLFDLFVEKMEAISGKDAILFINSLELLNFKEGEDCPLVSVFFYRPELEFSGDIDFKCKRPEHKSWEEYWNLYLNRLKNRNKILTPYEGSDIQENQSILIDISASCDGKPADDLSCRLKWVEVSQLAPESLKLEVLAHKKGDLFETSFIIEDSNESKTVKVHVKIHEIQTVALPEVNDDLAKTVKKNGKFCETMAMLEQEERQYFDEYQLNADRGTIGDHVINSMLKKAKIPPAPGSWLDYHAQRMMEQHMESNRNDATRAAKVLGLQDSESMLDFFRAKVHQDYVQDLVLRKYAKLNGIEFKFDVIFADMLAKAEWQS